MFRIVQFFFFFSSRRRHTRYIGDWSSDVCSSDLDTTDLNEAARVGVGHAPELAKMGGIHAGKKEDKLGWRASDTRELIFADAMVPKENVLGTVGSGFPQMLHTLDGGRIGIGALAP